VPPAAAARYRQLGAFIRGCYGGASKARLAAVSGVANNSLVLPLPGGAAKLDRFVVQEDQAFGQRVHAWIVWGAPSANPGTWEPLGQGQSIGNKRIVLMSTLPQRLQDMAYSELKLIVAVDDYMHAPAVIANFAAHQCSGVVAA
jgi:hypothetical protein